MLIYDSLSLDNSIVCYQMASSISRSFPIRLSQLELQNVHVPRHLVIIQLDSQPIAQVDQINTVGHPLAIGRDSYYTPP
jgi:hypothetical protein